MSFGPVSVFPFTVVSGSTFSSGLDLGKAWSTVYLEIQSMASNSQIYVNVAQSSAANFRRVCHPVTNSTVPQTIYEFAIQSGTTSDFVPIPNGFRYMRIELTSPVSGPQTFSFICMD